MTEIPKLYLFIYFRFSLNQIIYQFVKHLFKIKAEIYLKKEENLWGLNISNMFSKFIYIYIYIYIYIKLE